MQLACIHGQLDALVLRLGELLAQLGVFYDYGQELGGSLARIAHAAPPPCQCREAGLAKTAKRSHHEQCGLGVRDAAGCLMHPQARGRLEAVAAVISM
jgi:hypothetical protein